MSRMSLGSVLVIDSDEEASVFVRLLLERHGYSVRLSANGTSALSELSGDEPPELVLLDMSAPRTGARALLEAASASPRLRRSPIVVTSLHPEGMLSGAAAWLKKPYNPDALLGLVRKYGAQH